ncbi:MAG TPA: fluoride efflux transporter CrcB [Blastocatellia bacterium]|nr:fluoride efflux transporter CrcB [Blastocatellia bacterium]
MGKYIAVALGGALGAMARFWIGTLVSERFPTRFPLGTLIINVTGSFIIGFFLTLVTERLNIHPNWRLAVAVGFVGAYTTFSTFEYETFRLLETGSGISGFTNVIVSLMLGFLAVWGGVVLAREISAPDIVRQAMQSSIIRKTGVQLANPKSQMTTGGRESISAFTTDQPASTSEEQTHQQ